MGSNASRGHAEHASAQALTLQPKTASVDLILNPLRVISVSDPARKEQDEEQEEEAAPASVDESLEEDNDLTPSQQQALDSLVARVALEPTDAARLLHGEPVKRMLVRFLVATKWDVARAAVKLKADLAWREAEQIDRLVHLDVNTLLAGVVDESVLLSHLPTRFLGFDRERRPVVVQEMGQLDIDDLDVDVETLMRFHCWFMERCVRLLHAQPDAVAGARAASTFTFIIDAKGWNLGLMTKKNLAFVKMLAQVDSAHYPERMGRLFVVNAPPSLAVFWRLFKPLLDASTIEKISILSNPSEYRPLLLQHINAETLPAEYGGDREGYAQLPAFPPETARRASAGVSADATGGGGNGSSEREPVATAAHNPPSGRPGDAAAECDGSGTAAAMGKACCAPRHGANEEADSKLEPCGGGDDNMKGAATAAFHVFLSLVYTARRTRVPDGIAVIEAACPFDDPASLSTVVGVFRLADEHDVPDVKRRAVSWLLEAFAPPPNPPQHAVAAWSTASLFDAVSLIETHSEELELLRPVAVYAVAAHLSREGQLVSLRQLEKVSPAFSKEVYAAQEDAAHRRSRRPWYSFRRPRRRRSRAVICYQPAHA